MPTPSEVYLDDRVSDQAKRKFDAKAEEAILSVAWETMSGDLAEGEAARKSLPDLERRLVKLEGQSNLRPVLDAQLPALESRLKRLEGKPAILKATLTTPPPAAPKTDQRALNDPLSIVAAAMTAELFRFIKSQKPTTTLKQIWPKAEYRTWRRAANTLLVKSATDIATTLTPSWASELVMSDQGAWIEVLKSTSVFGALAALGHNVPMGGGTSFTYPGRMADDAGALAASFVGQGASLPVKNGSLASVTFAAYKAGVISVASNEILNVGAVHLFDIVKEMIIDDTSIMLDNVMLNTDLGAIAGVRPASPWNGTANQNSNGATLDDILLDLAWLIGSISPTRPRKPTLVIDNMRVQRLMTLREGGGFVFRDELAQGTLMGVPYIASANVPASKVFIVDAADFASWAPPPEIDISRSTTIVMADDEGQQPKMDDTNAINDSGGSLHVSDAVGESPAAKVIGTFQSDCSALRMVQPISWGMLRLSSAAFLTGVNW